MEEEFEDLKDRFWSGDGHWMTKGVLPTADLAETESHFEVTVDLPGLKPEDIEVDVKNGELWITGKCEEEQEEKGKTYHRIERHRGEIRRVLPMPSAINEEAIEAKFENGVLKVIVPKTEEAKPKHIEVKA